MVGGVLRTVGVLLLVLALVLLLGGLGALAYGTVDQQENEEEGLLGPDPERSEQNEVLVVGGAVAAGAGLLLLVLSILCFVTAGPRGREDSQGEAHVEAHEPHRPASLVHGPHVREASPSDASSRAVMGVVAVVLVAAVLLAGLLALNGGGDALLGRQQGPVAGTQDFNGTLPGSIVLPGIGEPGGQTSLEFPLAAPSDMKSLQATWAWESALGAETLRLALEVQQDGAWTEAVSGSGGPGGELVAEIGPEHPLRLVVTRASGASEAVDVQVLVTYLR